MLNEVKVKSGPRCFDDLTQEEKAILSMIPDTGKIRNHLERYGSITQMEATELYGITRLSARIYDLRYKKEPLMDIVGVLETGKDRFGQDSRYYRYYYKGEK